MHVCMKRCPTLPLCPCFRKSLAGHLMEHCEKCGQARAQHKQNYVNLEVKIPTQPLRPVPDACSNLPDLVQSCMTQCQPVMDNFRPHHPLRIAINYI